MRKEQICFMKGRYLRQSRLRFNMRSLCQDGKPLCKKCIIKNHLSVSSDIGLYKDTKITLFIYLHYVLII